jgi:NTP pyrophosphatase (non-canonical NTP hydrolase)
MNNEVWNSKEMEALVILQEECAEVVQAITKCFRYGKDGTHENTTNIERVEKEIGDVLCMIDYLIENCYLSDYLINEAKRSKKSKLKEWSNLYDTGTTD